MHGNCQLQHASPDCIAISAQQSGVLDMELARTVSHYAHVWPGIRPNGAEVTMSTAYFVVDLLSTSFGNGTVIEQAGQCVCAHQQLAEHAVSSSGYHSIDVNMAGSPQATFKRAKYFAVFGYCGAPWLCPSEHAVLSSLC